MNLCIKKKKGSTLVTVLVIASVVSALVFAMFVIFKNNDNAIRSEYESKELFFVAKSGIEIAEQALNANEKEFFVYDEYGHKVYDQDGNPVKVLRPKLMHDFEQGIVSNTPLVDTIDSTKLTELPDYITITISIDYIDKVKADALEQEDKDNGKPDDEIVRKENMFVIVSTAKNSDNNNTSVIRKYLDVNTLNSFYE